MTPDQTPAQEKAREIYDKWFDSLRGVVPPNKDALRLQDAISAALIAERQAGREDGLDEAAQVADDEAHMRVRMSDDESNRTISDNNRCRAYGAISVRDSIRALKNRGKS